MAGTLSSVQAGENKKPMVNGNIFTQKEKEFISVSASVAAGCRPCTEYHVNASQTAGLCDRSIALAIETAVTVRESATRHMEDWAVRCAGARPEVKQEFRNEKRLVAELAAVAAAAAVNSVPDATARIESAKLAGATREQIRAALAIAASIRATATQKLEAELGESMAKTGTCAEPAGSRMRGCGCGQ